MAVLYKMFVTRADIQAEPKVLWLFGDNEARWGMGGQAREFRGEPNAVGICTKRNPGTKTGDYWYDFEFDRCKAIIDQDITRPSNHVISGGTVVIPKMGLGTGLSALDTTSPRLFTYLQQSLSALYCLSIH